MACGEPPYSWQQTRSAELLSGYGTIAGLPWGSPRPLSMVERFEQLVRENADLEHERDALLKEVERLRDAARPLHGVGE